MWGVHAPSKKLQPRQEGRGRPRPSDLRNAALAYGQAPEVIGAPGPAFLNVAEPTDESMQ
jgi:hypothetical protein